MEAIYGQFTPDKRDGYLAPISFPQLARMDEQTPDGRELASSGFGARTLPIPIMAQFQTMPGHFTAWVVGTLQEIHFHDDGNISGRGWLIDTDEGRKMEHMLRTEALRQNSVDLADIDYEIRWESDDPDDPGFWEYTILFTNWKIAATTFVNVPAFPEARGEIMASGSPISCGFDEHEYRILLDDPTYDDVEIVASAGQPAFADFHVPEAAEATAITVDEQGRVFGHLALWGECHEGIDDRCVLAPRPADYRAFHGPKVLTDKGLVETGPIFALGGHPARPLGDGDRFQAYGGIENAWADVRVVNGRLGPWMSGRVRPGIDPAMLYKVRASRISGHWRTDGSLAAIVSVNGAGFNVPGTEIDAYTGGGSIRDGQMVDLVASMRQPRPAEATLERRAELAKLILSRLNADGSTARLGETESVVTVGDPALPVTYPTSSNPAMANVSIEFIDEPTIEADEVEAPSVSLQPVLADNDEIAIAFQMGDAEHVITMADIETMVDDYVDGFRYSIGSSITAEAPSGLTETIDPDDLAAIEAELALETELA